MGWSSQVPGKFNLSRISHDLQAWYQNMTNIFPQMVVNNADESRGRIRLKKSPTKLKQKYGTANKKHTLKWVFP